ncbi:hypothetical protein [Fusobacterium varium]|uniref:hypothetical protein n=1 Tax=Fusobacterium varium TaxID=856 RepID=UPI002430C915|nr:hypothetical protein [Fusobacterium varium]
MESEEKRKWLFILGIIILILSIIFTKDYRAERVLQKHLKARYGEEFVIFGMGKRAGNVRRWYEAAVIYPKSYIGTRKENDSYYWGKGFVDLNNGMKGGDTYGGVLLNESANKFYGKKLKELFGENYLAVLDVGGYYESIDFEEEMKKRKKSYDESPNGVFPPISGGIYIFGRVENDEDREWYRKQIYEFIQFMKETGTFEYVALDFNIADERIISKEFEEIHLKTELIQLYEEALSNKIKGEIFIEKRKNILDKVGKNYIVDFSELEKWNKGEIVNLKNKLGMAGTINLCKILSEKYIKANKHFYKEYELKFYNNINDVKIEG